MMKNTAIYLRSADPNIDARHTDKPIFDFIERHDELSITAKDCLMYWDDCLGNFDPHKRSGFSKLMCDIRRKEIKSVIIAEPCVISTYPQMLISTLYDLVILGVTVYCIDGTEITYNIIRAFDYCGILAQVENLIAQNVLSSSELSFRISIYLRLYRLCTLSYPFSLIIILAVRSVVAVVCVIVPVVQYVACLHSVASFGWADAS